MDVRVLQNCTSENAALSELRSTMRWIMAEEVVKKESLSINSVIIALTSGLLDKF